MHFVAQVVDRAMAKIDDLLKNPVSGVFYFRQLKN
jgi:hypothetical protein